MAKLKAHGRTELFRMVRQEPPDAEGVERKTVYAFMSDGVVLRNVTVKHPTVPHAHDKQWFEHAPSPPIDGTESTVRWCARCQEYCAENSGILQMAERITRTGWRLAKLHKELGYTTEQREQALRLKGFVRGGV